jgi:hypothetical protein
MTQLAKTLIIIGAVLALLGVLLMLLPKVPFLGKLPGDIFIRKKNFEFYFPLTTSLLVSGIITLILWLFRK